MKKEHNDIAAKPDKTLLPGDTVLGQRMQRWVGVFAIIVLVMAVLVLLDWQFDIGFLKQPLTALATMNPATAILFIFCSLSILLLTTKAPSYRQLITGRILGGLALLTGSMLFFPQVFGLDIPVDTILFHNKLTGPTGGDISKRMGINTALCFVLTGIALLLVDIETRRKRMPAHYFAVVIFLMGLLAVVGFLYHVKVIYGTAVYVPMAIHTGLCFIFLPLAILFAHPDRGLMKELTSQFNGGIIARFFVPVVIVVPVLLGYLRMWGDQTGILPADPGATLLILGIVVIFLAMTWYFAVLLNKGGRQKQDDANILLENEEQEEAIFDAAPNAVIVIDEESKIIKWNSSTEKLLGWSKKEVLGQLLSEIIIPDYFRESFKNSMRHFLRTGEGPLLGKKIETVALTKNGDFLDVELSIAASTKVKGKFLFIGFITDLAALKKTEKKFHALLDTAPDALIVVDKKGEIVLVNRQTETTFGYNRIELIGKPIELLMPADFRPAHMEHRYKYFGDPKTRTMGTGPELFARRKDGTQFPVEISLSPLQTEEGLLVSASVRDVTKRKEAQENLKKAESQYRLMIDEVEDYAIIFLDTTGVIRNWNRGAEKIKGYKAAEIIGKNFSQFYTKEDQALGLPEKLIQDATKYGKAIHEGWRIRKDGTAFWASITITALHDEERKLIGFTKVTRDFTDLKKAEEKFRSLLDAAPDATVIVSETGIIQMINRQTENLFGYSRDELIGQHVEILIPEDLRNKHVQHRGGFFKAAKVRTMGAGIELKAVKKNGTSFPVEISLSPLQTDEGLLVSASVRDITDRNTAREKFRSLLDAAPDATVIVDEKGIIQMINQQTENLFGYSRDEMLGKTVEILIPAELHSKHTDHRRDFFRTPRIRTMGAGLELNAVKKNGTRFPVEISLAPLDTEEGMLVSASVRDITSRKELEDALKKSNAEMEAFTYSVSHDLRAPLRGIIGFTAMLEEDYTSKLDAEAKRITGVIKHNTLKMGHLIDDLLAFSRMGKQELLKTNINTQAMVSEIVDELTRENNGNNGINWNIQALPDVNGDINTIRQVWINLISNAIKYSGKREHPGIDIGNYHEKEQTVFYVKDNGVGFDEQYGHKLFKVFQRLHSADDYEGTGVGLALVEKVVTRHDGKVWAEGKEDAGACFYFSLPD